MRVLGTSVGQERVHIKMAAASAPELPQIPDTVVPTPQEPVVPDAPNPWSRPPTEEEPAPVVVSYRRHENWPALPPNTYLFEFFGSGAWGQNSEVARAALVSQGLCLQDDIMGGFYLERPGQHYVQFKPGVTMNDKLDGKEIFIRDRINAKVSAVYQTHERIRIYGVHPSLTKNQLRYELQKFLPDWETCIIEPPRKMALSEIVVKTKTKREQIPHHIEATDPQGLKYTMRVVVPGRQTICPICQEATHFANQCTARKATRRDRILETEAQGKKKAEEEQTTPKSNVQETTVSEDEMIRAEQLRQENERRRMLMDKEERDRMIEECNQAAEEADKRKENEKGNAEKEWREKLRAEARKQRAKVDKMKEANKKKDDEAGGKKKKVKGDKTKKKSKKVKEDGKDKKKPKKRVTDEAETSWSDVEAIGMTEEESEGNEGEEENETEGQEADTQNDSFHTTNSDVDDTKDRQSDGVKEAEGIESGEEERVENEQADITNFVTHDFYANITEDIIDIELQGKEREAETGVKGNVAGRGGVATSTPTPTPQKRKTERNSSEPDGKKQTREEGESSDDSLKLIINDPALLDDFVHDKDRGEEGQRGNSHSGGV